MKYNCATLRKITEENELAINGEDGKLLTKAQLCNQLLNRDCEITLDIKKADEGNAKQTNVLNANTNACPA